VRLHVVGVDRTGDVNQFGNDVHRVRLRGVDGHLGGALHPHRAGEDVGFAVDLGVLRVVDEQLRCGASSAISLLPPE
jgi:hypothetical protein